MLLRYMPGSENASSTLQDTDAFEVEGERGTGNCHNRVGVRSLLYDWKENPGQKGQVRENEWWAQKIQWLRTSCFRLHEATRSS